MENQSYLAQTFLPQYETASFLIKKKAATLMYYCTTLFVLLIVLGILFAVFLPNIFAQAAAVIVTTLCASIVALYLLKRGNYYGAANLITIITTIAVIAGLLVKIGRDAYAGYTTFVYFMIALIVQTTLFCTRKWIAGVSILFFVTNIVFFLLVKSRLDPISLKAAKVGVLDFGFTLVFTYVLSHLIIKITDEAIDFSETESKKNLENYYKIEKLLGSARDTSQRLASSAEELASTAVSFSSNSQTQAASAEEIMATIEEVSAGVDNVALNTRDQFERMNSLMEKMNNLSMIIGTMGSDVAITMDLTRTIATDAAEGEGSLNSMNAGMQRINQSSTEMTGIIAIINKISDQINLLALNATIEAARAGEAGRGFAVVADEISKLAEQTAASLKEIGSLIRMNNAEISSGFGNVKSTVETISRIISGVNTIRDMIAAVSEKMKQQQSLNTKVNEEADRVKLRANEIKNATEEQKNAVAEIVRSIANVNELTQSYASGAEKLSTSARSVEGIAQALNEKVETFS